MKRQYWSALVLLLCALPSVAGNLIEDGGFEHSKSRWKCVPASQVKRSGRTVFDGKVAMCLAAEPGQNVAQLFSPDYALEVGAEKPCVLRLSFRYKGHKGGVFLNLLKKEGKRFVATVDELGKPAFSSFRIPEAAEWTEFQKEITIPVIYLNQEPGFRLQFQCWHDELYIDDVNIAIVDAAPSARQTLHDRLSQAATHAENLVPDPGFETGSWGYAGNFGKSGGKAERSESSARSGKFGFKLQKNGPDGAAQLFSHEFQLGVGCGKDCVAELGFSAKGGGVALICHLLERKAGKYVPVSDGKKNIEFTIRAGASATWQSVKERITIPARYLGNDPAIRMHFMLWGAKGGVESEIDDVSFKVLDGEKVTPKAISTVTVIAPPSDDNGAPPMPRLPYKYGIKNGMLTRDGKPFFYMGSTTVGGGQWNMQTLWMLRLLDYSMCTVDICTNYKIDKDAAGRYTITWNEAEPAISVIRELTRMGILIEADAGNYMPGSRNLFREMKKTAPEYGNIFTTSSHFYSFDHNTELGRSFHYNDWLSRFRYLKDFPFMAFECWNELGYRPTHERALVGFRKFAEHKYGTLAEANKVWKCNFKSWEEVMPPHLSKNTLSGAQEHQYRLAMREKYFQMYYDYLRFVQEDFVPGFKLMKEHFRTFSSSPWSVDWRGHRHYSDGYCALDIDLLEDVIDINLLHTWISPYDYNGEAADAPSVLDSISTALLYHNFLRTNSSKPIMNPEDILEKVMTPGSNLEAMKRNCLGQFPDKWNFKLERDNRGIASGYFKPDFDDSSWGKMAVPGCWDETEEYKGKRGIGWYRADFDIPMTYRQDYLDGSRKFYVYGKGVAQKGTVWVNGICVGDVRNWADQYQYDIGAYLKFGGKNQITVMADGSGFKNGIRFYIHILPNNLINKTRPCGEKEYATRLWSYMMQGSSGVALWSWEDCWRPFLPRLINEVNSVAEIAMPDIRRETGREVGFLLPYLFFRGLPEASEKYYMDYMNFFGASMFRQLPVSVFSEKNILKTTPDRYPLIFYPYARIVHHKTFDHMKKYVENGGTAVITLDSMLMDFERYTDMGLARFSGVSVIGDYSGKPEISYDGKRYPLQKGDMCQKTGVRINAPGAGILATYADGSPAVVKIQRGKGNIIFAAANLGLRAVYDMLGELIRGKEIDPTIKVEVTDSQNEFPYVEGRTAGNSKRFMVYLHNWGGLDRSVSVRFPANLLKAQNYRIRNVRNILQKEKDVSTAELAKNGWNLNIPPGTPAAVLFEDASCPAMAFKGVAPEREHIINKISADDRNPPNLNSAAPKALFLAPFSPRERIGRIIYPQVAECLRRSGIEVWEFPLDKLTPEFLKKFNMVFIGEGHSESIRPLNNRKHPFYHTILEYVRNGGSLMIAGGSAIGYQFNAHQQLNSTFGAMLGFSCSAWSSADNYPRNPDSCGYNDPRQIRAVDFTDHPVAKYLKSVQFFTLPVFRIKPGCPMKAIVKTSNNDSVAPDLPLMIGGSYGKGRMIFTSDLLWFQPFRIEAADNFQLLMNCINYLTRREIIRYSDSKLKNMLLMSEKEIRQAEITEKQL